eukprot:TRINITY_DN95023_c0_g1_i1.p1 TRINITY_DN95023_c0_g1~~TRINITY_DN95023_c0_g1_i1.p1  ORF type:complete len:228 (-),score=29.26 TRINITY_DN95023_c0_g1_i1:78-761(-)
MQCAARQRPLRDLARQVQKVERREADFGGWTGEIVWEAARVLVGLLAREPHWILNRRVLEVGSGCGLLGLAAGALGARQVTMTDQVTYMANYNLELNFQDQPEVRQRFRLQPLNWGNMEEITATEPPYELVLGADLMYNETLYSALADTLMHVSGPGTIVLWATPHGPEQDQRAAQFYQKLINHGFSIQDISTRPAVVEALKAAPNPYPRGPIHVLQMQLGQRQSRL